MERPDFAVKIPRIDPPERGEYEFSADSQNSEGGIYHLHGHAVIEVFDATFKADDAEYDENTKIFTAHGNVYYRNYERNEVIYCDRAEYNSETGRGTFYHVKGYTKTKVVARQGVLTTQEPFYFEAEWAEKIGVGGTWPPTPISFSNRELGNAGFTTGRLGFASPKSGRSVMKPRFCGWPAECQVRFRGTQPCAPRVAPICYPRASPSTSWASLTKPPSSITARFATIHATRRRSTCSA